MSNLAAIEQKIASINGAKFQNLADTVLFYNNYPGIVAVGSVIGKEKTRKGTPDSYVPLRDGGYVFIEYTTQERLEKNESFFHKLKSDIESCFDQSKSKIAPSEVKKVILCFTNRLKAGEDDELKKYCKSFNIDCEFEALGIDYFKNQLLRLPALAKDFLDISIDSGQILPLFEFIKRNESGILATTLSNALLHRGSEKDAIKASLGSKDLILLSGPSGIGKTKIALEVAKEFATENVEYEVLGISSRDQLDIWEDLNRYILSGKKYLIIFDDANRATKNLQLLLRYRANFPDREIKVLITVRDYAQEAVKKDLNAFENEGISLSRLSDENIQDILKSDDFKIKNGKYLERITYLAKGNLRIAIIAADLALKAQSLGELQNAWQIYDEYFNTITEDTEVFSSGNLARILGIVSFFGIIDLNFGDLLDRISEYFNIGVDEFREGVLRLHELEAVDLFDNEIAKISDQVLGNFFFFKVFIRDGQIPFDRLLEGFYESHREQVRDSVYGALNTFGYENVQPLILPHVSSFLDSYDEPNDKIRILQIFWAILPEETLSFAKMVADGKIVGEEPDYRFSYDTNDFVWDKGDDLYELLIIFLRYPDLNFGNALSITLNYVRSIPELVPRFTKHVVENLTFDRRDPDSGYFRQKQLFATLKEGIDSAASKSFYVQFFLAILPTFLKVEFQKAESTGGPSIRIYQIKLQDNEPLRELRSDLWGLLLGVWDTATVESLDVVGKYCSGELGAEESIWAFDLSFLKGIFEKFSSDSFAHCRIIHSYSETLDRYNFPYTDDLRSKFGHPLIDLSKTINPNYILKEGHDEYEKRKKGLIDNFTEGMDVTRFKDFYHQLIELYNHEGDESQWQFHMALTDILVSIEGKVVGSILDCLKIIIDEGNTSGYHLRNIVQFALKQIGVNHKMLFDAIERGKFNLQKFWTIDFLACLPADYVDSSYIESLLQFAKTIPDRFRFWDLDFLGHYDNWKPSFWDRLTGLFSRKKRNRNRNIYTMFFGLLIEQVEKPKKRIDFGHRSLNQQTINAFGDEINDLKAIYLNQCVVDNHFDYEGKSLKLICERDQGFIYEFFDHYSAKFRIGVGLPEWISKRFSFLFDSEDYNDQIEKVFILLSERFPVIGNFKNSVVVLFEDAIKDADRRNRAVKLIDQMLSEHFESTALTRSLFNVIVHCLREERIKYLIQFVELNNDKKCFDLVTEGFGHHEAVSGDWIPIYEEEMEFWETVLQDLRNLTPTVDYVHHIASVKKRIEYCQRSIQRQRKRDFTDFYRQ